MTFAALVLFLASALHCTEIEPEHSTGPGGANGGDPGDGDGGGDPVDGGGDPIDGGGDPIDGGGDPIDGGGDPGDGDGGGDPGDGNGGGDPVDGGDGEGGPLAAELAAVVTVHLTVGGASYDLQVMRCSHGQNLTDASCSGSAAWLTYCTENTNACNGGVTGAELTGSDQWLDDQTSEVWNACDALNRRHDGQGFAGIDTWRLPRCFDDGDTTGAQSSPADCELYQLYLYGVSEGGENTFWYSAEPAATEFPNTVGVYWSSSSNSALSSEAWLVSFGNGAIVSNFKWGNQYSVRCVSGEP